MSRRAVITGMGVVCSAGGNIAAFAANVVAGTPCFSPIGDQRVSHFRARFAGLVPEAVLADQPGSPSRWGVDKCLRIAAEAARQAVASSGLDVGGNGTGIVAATCSGPMLTIESYHADRLAGATAFSAEDFLATRYFSVSRMLARLFGISGPNLTVTTACSASVNALAVACDFIALGELDAVLVGGADSFSLTTLAGFDGLKATCEDRCAPFSKPQGMNLGEGAAFVVVESLEHARARSASVIAEILGSGSSNDAHHATSPDPTGRGPALAMSRALAASGLPAEAITYINAHGTGTEANDKAETRAIKRLFGERSGAIPISSIKAVTGHCLGAAGMVELVGVLAAARQGVLPPTGRFTGAREGCDLDYVAAPGRPWSPAGPFLKSNLAFGGNNASIVVTTDTGHATMAACGVVEKVVVTGVGVVSPAGVGLDALCGAVRAGKPLGGQVPPFDPRAADRRLDVRGMDRLSQLATVAAQLALSCAGIGTRPSERMEIGFVHACAHAPAWAEAEHITSLLKADFRINQITAFPYIVPNSVAGNVCRALGLTGSNNTLCLGAGASLLGLAAAVNAVRCGHAKALVYGSADDLTPAQRAYLSFSPEACALPAEGSVMLVLEAESAARARGARIMAEVLAVAAVQETGLSAGRDADPRTAKDCIRQVLKRAGIGAGDIAAVCCRSADAGETVLLDELPAKQGGVRDCSVVTGLAEASFPLLNLVCHIADPALEERPRGNYILTIFRSAYGTTAAAVLRTVSRP